MPISIPDYSTGLSTTTELDAGTYSLTQVTEGFSIPQYDYISLSYTGSNVTGVTYKQGGSGGLTVATLTLTYDGSDNLTSVTRS